MSQNLPQNPKLFSQLPISSGLKKSLEENGFTKLKQIQTQAIPHLLAGKNVFGASPTGSGKTLAFLIPAIEMLTFSKARPFNGTLAIVLSPTRELAKQTFSVARTLMKNISSTVGCLTGGNQSTFKDEKYHLSKNQYNLLISTPGRLCQHLDEQSIKLTNFQFLIIDEVDRMLENGFANELLKIFDIIKTPRQTALFSATLTKDVEGLMQVSVSSKPIFCCPTESNVVATLEHFYCVTDVKYRIALLMSMLQKLRNQRVCVFVNTRYEAEFLSRIFNAIGLDNVACHGDLPQNERDLAFVKFNRNELSIIISTNVTSRGVDFPDVNYSISLGPPDHVKDYIHRSGRSARNEKEGRSIIILSPTELKFVDFIRQSKIKIRKIEPKLDNIELNYQKLCSTLNETDQFAELAIKAHDVYVSAYKNRSKDSGITYDKLDPEDVRASFGLL